MPDLRLIFDLDDTLYPERDFAISGFRACERWLEETHGVGDVVGMMTQGLDDGLMRQLFEVALDTRLPGHTPEVLETFIDIYRYHEPSIALYDDASHVLDHYGDAGHPLGLITDGQDDVQSSKVRALALEPRFHHIIYTHALGGRGFSKPNPRAFELMESAIGNPGDRFVYVGDNPAKDFVAPNRMGWITIQIYREQRIHSRATTAEGGEPQHVIHSLRDLPELLAAVNP